MYIRLRTPRHEIVLPMLQAIELLTGKTLVLALLFLFLLAIPPTNADQPAVDFNRDIRPILSDNCYHCHGPDAAHREADLRLDVEEDALADLGGHYAVVPSAVDKSELVARIVSMDPDERMPPVDSGKKLSASQIDLLRRWIAEGAVWSKPWSYVPPRQLEIPTVKQADWPLNWIDRFVLARLETEGIAPAPEADSVTLIRRLSFDLIGLPPTPAEVGAFVEDRSADAYEQLVDRLLSSPHYGERMAIYWLDLVRYADTVGYHGDQDHNISPYRDYVINAFNDNIPLDQFTREQLAGDLIPHATHNQKIATGYNRLLQTTHEGGLQPNEYLAIYAADRIRNFSNVWMAATMGCCQCHDHKYDPYSAKDFYSMVAFFADIDEAQHFTKGGNLLPTNRPPELTLLSPKQQKKITGIEAAIAGQKKVLDGMPKVAPASPEFTAQKDAIEKLVKQLNHQITVIRSQAPKTMITVSIQPRTIRVLPRGDWLDETGKIVEPAVPEFLPAINIQGRRANRLDLANWLTDAEQGVGGLTARAFANRFWYLCFGTGIARVMDDFGGQGEPPANLELLDNLAVEFMNSSWDVKQMMKLLVMSRSYRQSSLSSPELQNRDPYNQLTARQSRYRLPAELVRDNVLAISGLLVRDVGGPSIRPYQPVGYYANLNFPERTYQHDTDQGQWRRGVYMHWQRQFLHPMLKAFDAPSREECTAQRPQSNTPLAALALLNDPTFLESARVFAQRILTEGGSNTATRLDYAFRLSVSHKPDEAQRKLLTSLLKSLRQQYAKDPEAATKIVSTGLSPVDNASDTVELAAWTGVARAILNMNESITRN